jgi:hypothetical protein
MSLPEPVVHFDVIDGHGFERGEGLCGIVACLFGLSKSAIRKICASDIKTL